ncbi:MAG: amino acid--tRNA ligase-related protein [Candidatus Taylorbacteria bacterium]|nr:amino acid--tRNA ligase-related protein [Candidatus Taylorbacteria bacterium]
MFNNYIATKDINSYNTAVSSLRAFFKERGFIEMHTQDRLSILAACEDPSTIATFTYAGEVWPLPQTGQMWLEYELLRNPEIPGVFCVSTSFRNEQNPIPGRHKIIFPMFEFESIGTIDDLRKLERDLCVSLGFRDEAVHHTYDDLANHYETEELTSEHEMKMQKDFSPVTFIEMFPQKTSPFWNMKKNGEHAHKIDVILYGMETIGSAERSTNPEEMNEKFHSISEGKYAQTLYDAFGKDRVERELNDFLSLDFFPRFGGGIGLTRLIRAMNLASAI